MIISTILSMYEYASGKSENSSLLSKMSAEYILRSVILEINQFLIHWLLETLGAVPVLHVIILSSAMSTS